MDYLNFKNNSMVLNELNKLVIAICHCENTEVARKILDGDGMDQ